MSIFNFSWTLQSIASFLLTLIFVSFVLRSKKPPGSTWAWLLLIVVLPYVGIPAYLIFSNRKIGSRLQRKEAQHPPVARDNNNARLITSGTAAFDEMIALIDGATAQVDIATFIFSKDSVGEAILQHLIVKAGQGVKVRVLLDSLGALWVSHPSFKGLKKAGGQIGFFMPLIHWPSRGRSNLRNHRKILVVDGMRALVGGMNIAREYMGPTDSQNRWIDLALRIEGDSAVDVAQIFNKDWQFATRQVIETGDVKGPKVAAGHWLKIIAGGPDAIGDPIYEALLTLIFKAEKRIWVASPYFIPDETLARALQLAAGRGVDVRILIPEKSNHAIADLARGSYVRQLAAAKCKIRLLPKMIHAKAFLIDESHALIGSANFDMRSLLYNFEIGALLSTPADIKVLAEWFSYTLEESIDCVAEAGFWRDMAEGVGRVLGPLI